MAVDDKSRCGWATTDESYLDYHDKEWGVPLYSKNALFEFLILEGMQAGLNWLTILKKRENYRKAFDNFDPEKIVRYKPQKIEKLLQNSGIIRNRLKIESIINNAKCYLTLRDHGIDFTNYLWQFVDFKPIQNQWKTLSQIPATTAISDKMSKELKKQGFKFVGSTICYAHMQAVGMVNDHLVGCFRHEEVKRMGKRVPTKDLVSN